MWKPPITNMPIWYLEILADGCGKFSHKQQIDSVGWRLILWHSSIHNQYQFQFQFQVSISTTIISYQMMMSIRVLNWNWLKTKQEKPKQGKMKARQNERIFITSSFIHPSIHLSISMPCQVRIDWLDSITKTRFILPDDISSHLIPHSSSPMRWSCCAIYVVARGALHTALHCIARDLLWSSLCFSPRYRLACSSLLASELAR